MLCLRTCTGGRGACTQYYLRTCTGGRGAEVTMRGGVAVWEAHVVVIKVCGYTATLDCSRLEGGDTRTSQAECATGTESWSGHRPLEGGREEQERR